MAIQNLKLLNERERKREMGGERLQFACWNEDFRAMIFCLVFHLHYDCAYVNMFLVSLYEHMLKMH